MSDQAVPSNGKAIASLVLGILAVLCVFLGTYALIGVVLGIIGLVLGINAKKEMPSSMAQAGIVLSIIAIAICVIGFLACIACIGSLAAIGSSMS